MGKSKVVGTDQGVSVADLEALFKIDDDYLLAKTHLAPWRDLNHL